MELGVVKINQVHPGSTSAGNETTNRDNGLSESMQQLAHNDRDNKSNIFAHNRLLSLMIIIVGLLALAGLIVGVAVLVQTTDGGEEGDKGQQGMNKGRTTQAQEILTTRPTSEGSY